jgi:hypothetical protein
VLTSADYIMAWSIYLLSAVVLMLWVWRLTRRFWGWLRDLLRVALAVTMLLPAAASDSSEHLAPAVFVAAFELLSAPEGGLGPLLGVRLLLVMMFSVLGVWMVRLLWYWLIDGRRSDG